MALNTYIDAEEVKKTLDIVLHEKKHVVYDATIWRLIIEFYLQL